MASQGTSFAVDQAYRNSPQQAANWFLNNWSGLLVNYTPRNNFRIIRDIADKSNNYYIRYQQYYNGLEVFGAQLNCMVDASGGVVAVLSDIMRDTEPLDSGRISLIPNLTPLNAKNSVIKYLSNEYPTMKFELNDPNLMIFDPKVVGWSGDIRLVWNIKANSTVAGAVSEGLLMDAQNSEIVFVQSFIYNGRNRKIYDYTNVKGEPPPPTGSPARGENDDETDVPEIDNAWEYLGDTYNFYYSHHSRDSYDGSGGDLIAAVLYQDPCYPDYNDAFWFDKLDNPNLSQSYMLIHSGYALIDVIGHEFTHGVTNRTSELSNAAEESGAITESFSDMWGAWIDQETNQDYDDWTIGEDDQINGTWRDMKNPHDSQWYSGPEFLYEPNKWRYETGDIGHYTH
jgi:Zn-dependent metalloprotease